MSDSTPPADERRHDSGGTDDRGSTTDRIERLEAVDEELRDRVEHLETALAEVVPGTGRGPARRSDHSTTGNAGSTTVLPSGGQAHKVVGKFSDSNGGVGVYGHNTAGSGTTYGVWGEVDSSDGYGLYTPSDAKVDGALSVGDDTPQETAGPIAKGVIRDDGFIRNAQGVANAEYFSSPEPSYNIEFSNFSYNNEEYVTVVSPIDAPAMIDIGQAGVDPKKCVVQLFDETGTAIQSEFQFATYKVTP